MSDKGSKPKKKGGPLRIPTEEEGPMKLTKKDLLGLLPVINIALAIIFILLIPNFFIDLLLLFMLVLTITFYFSMIAFVWQQKPDDLIEKSLLIYNKVNINVLNTCTIVFE